jgi:hypothetical protein
MYGVGKKVRFRRRVGLYPIQAFSIQNHQMYCKLAPFFLVFFTYFTHDSCGWFQAPLELFLNNAFRHRLGHV